MESLEFKYAVTLKAVNKINDVLKKIEANQVHPEEWEEVLQMALVKSFEFSMDTLWKYLKLYLLEKHGVEQNSPKAVIRECLRVGAINQTETEIALDMLEDRNRTSHIYREEVANEIADSIKDYYTTMKTILVKTAP